MIALRWGFAIGTIDFFPVSRRELSLHHNRTNIFPGCFTWNIAAYVGIFAHTTKLPEIDASNVANHCSSIGLPQTSDNIKLYSIMFTWNIAFLWSKLCAINRTFPGKAQFNFCQAQKRRLSLPHNSDSRFPYCFTWYIYLSILVQEHGNTRINAGLNMPHPMISLQWYLHYFRESISLNLKWEPAQLSLPTGWQLQFQGSVTCSAQTYYSPYHSDFSDESNDSSLLL